MTQDPHIFDDTVEYNVKYSKQDASIEEIHEACKLAGIHKTIMKRRDQYQTKTGANGG